MKKKDQKKLDKTHIENCPFCGSTPIWHRHYCLGYYDEKYLMCSNEDCILQDKLQELKVDSDNPYRPKDDKEFEEKLKVIHKWNNRSTTQEPKTRTFTNPSKAWTPQEPTHD